MSKIVKAKLRVLDHRGETVHTRWGNVTFDADGLAEVEVPEDELQMLRETKPFPWLVEPVDEAAEPSAEDAVRSAQAALDAAKKEATDAKAAVDKAPNDAALKQKLVAANNAVMQAASAKQIADKAAQKTRK